MDIIKIKQSQKGYTLIEVLLVIVLIGILLTIGLVSLNTEARFIENRNDTRKYHIRVLEGAITQYKLQTGSYPIGLDRTYREICDPDASSCSGFVDLKQFLVPNYLQAIPQDPKDTDSTGGTGYSVAVDEATNTVSVRALQAEGGVIIAVNDPLPAEATVTANTPLASTVPVVPPVPSFTMTVKTNNAGSSLSNQFTIPTTGTGYNYNVDWGDGSISTGVTGNITKTYSTEGTYEVAITGAFPRIFFNGGGDRLKLTEINSWGPNAWTSMANAFQGTVLAIEAIDTPNLSNVTNMSNMFYGANLSGSNLSNWNVSAVTNMTSMFQSANLSGSNLANWTLKSNVVVADMFRSAANLPDLSSWNVSAVTNMTQMFLYANLAGTNIGSWNVSGATNMTSMFNSASNIPNLSNWNVSAVTNMSNMFYGVNLSGSNLANWTLKSNVVVADMFRSATNLPDLSSWNVSAVTNMTNMFVYANLAGTNNIGSWNVSGATNMTSMFYGASNIPNLSNWNVSAVTNMTQMFYGATTFNQNLSGWCVSSIPSKPTGFDTGATAWTLSRPIWGTCP